MIYVSGNVENKSNEEKTISRVDSHYSVRSRKICSTKIPNNYQFTTVYPCRCGERDLEHLRQVSLSYFYQKI